MVRRESLRRRAALKDAVLKQPDPTCSGGADENCGEGRRHLSRLHHHDSGGDFCRNPATGAGGGWATGLADVALPPRPLWCRPPRGLVGTACLGLREVVAGALT